MKRIALDTSVLIAAMIGRGGVNLDVVEACIDGRLVPVPGAALFAEYRATIARDDIFNDSRLDRSEREELLSAFVDVCRWQRIYFVWRPNLRDEGDNHLVDLAVAAGAEMIVTRNRRDLESGELRFEGIKIVSPADALEMVAE